MKLLMSMVLLFFFVPDFAKADVYEEIAGAIRSGSAHQVAGFFDEKIDLAFSNQEDVYSKAQAEMLLKDFFSKNPPKSFVLVHKGSSKEGSLFAVGTLTTSMNKSFRVSMVIKSAKGTNTIQELRFEIQ